MRAGEQNVGGIAVTPAYLKDPQAAAAFPASLAGTWPAHNARRYTAPLYDEASVGLMKRLTEEVLGIAACGATPDGQGVSAETLLWAQEWRRRFECDASVDGDGVSRMAAENGD